MAPVQNYIHTSCISFTPRAQPTASHWKNVHLMFMLQNFASDELNFSLAEGHLKAVFVNPNTLIWIRIQDFGLILMKIQGYAINFEREKL